LDVFSKETGVEGEDTETQVSDLLCNLMHLVYQQGLDFEACIVAAVRNHVNERGEDIE
jgi:hypothetical protein